MAYNNDDIYNAALAGSAAALSASRNNRSINSSDYDTMTSVCQAFATEIDSLIPPIGGGPNDLEIDAMHSICTGYWITRYPQSIVPSSYLTVARQIVALWTSVVSKGV